MPPTCSSASVTLKGVGTLDSTTTSSSASAALVGVLNGDWVLVPSSLPPVLAGISGLALYLRDAQGLRWGSRTAWGVLAFSGWGAC